MPGLLKGGRHRGVLFTVLDQEDSGLDRVSACRKLGTFPIQSVDGAAVIVHDANPLRSNERSNERSNQ